jgi:hypothetical protein
VTDATLRLKEAVSLGFTEAFLPAGTRRRPRRSRTSRDAVASVEELLARTAVRPAGPGRRP